MGYEETIAAIHRHFAQSRRTVVFERLTRGISFWEDGRLIVATEAQVRTVCEAQEREREANRQMAYFLKSSSDRARRERARGMESARTRAARIANEAVVEEGPSMGIFGTALEEARIAIDEVQKDSLHASSGHRRIHL